MRFDLIDLRLFLAVVDAGSITHGAAEAGMSLAAASERLRDMEADGEVTLLIRGRRGIATTEAGETLAHHARTILNQMGMMRGELGNHAKGLRSTVRVLANTAAINEFLPERLASWMAANPQVDLDLKERQSSEIARSVAAGFAEIGILSAAVDTAGLALFPFAVDRLVVVLRADDALAKRDALRFADILDRPLIGLSSGALQEHIEAQAAKLGRRPAFRLRLPTFEGICRLTGAGAGIGVVPETAALRFARQDCHAVVRLTDDWATRTLSLCLRDAGELSAPARSLFHHLRESDASDRG